MLVTLLAQQHHQPDRRGEQDELLAHRVQPAEVEVDRRDHVGGVALGHRHPIEHRPVDAVIVAEGRQPGKPVHEYDPQHHRADGEQGQNGRGGSWLVAPASARAQPGDRQQRHHRYRDGADDDLREGDVGRLEDEEQDSPAGARRSRS